MGIWKKWKGLLLIFRRNKKLGGIEKSKGFPLTTITTQGKDNKSRDIIQSYIISSARKDFSTYEKRSYPA
ncbi:hypothetical protein [Candidatus Azobacteroides pseudotrichonymphae]|uniref:hypothetical protein n=1 Tax=Candidatus Azobacteroides pseudotrichonymphae TaxID=511435 RepID=UPI0002DB8867|nr:hypothetical protein [Candidatus Azobacteroides pseudotrichonymphae]